MEAKELRIGNYVMTNFKRVEEIIDIKPIDFIEDYIKLYKPIPLTEEYLLKFGFENIRFKYEIDKFIIWLDPRSTYYHLNYEGGSIEVKYVHALQNLYFALTNKELTLNN